MASFWQWPDYTSNNTNLNSNIFVKRSINNTEINCTDRVDTIVRVPGSMNIMFFINILSAIFFAISINWYDGTVSDKEFSLLRIISQYLGLERVFLEQFGFRKDFKQFMPIKNTADLDEHSIPLSPMLEKSEKPELTSNTGGKSIKGLLNYKVSINVIFKLF